MGTEQPHGCGTAQMLGPTICVWVVLRRMLADPSPGLAVCLRHKAFEVNDGKPGLGSYAQTTHISCSSDVGLHEDVCELRLSPICSEAFLKPRPGSRLNSLNGQEPDRNTFPNWRKKLS